MTATLLAIVLAQGPAVMPTNPLSASVKTIDGAALAIPVPKAKATVLIFTSVDCPIANRMAPEVARIQKAYAAKNVQVVLVYADPKEKAANVKAHLKEYKLSGPAVIDVKKVLRKGTGASVTPHAAILDPVGKVVYLGRINDLYREHGRVQIRPSKNDLREALDELLAGKPISTPYTQAVGCYLQD